MPGRIPSEEALRPIKETPRREILRSAAPQRKDLGPIAVSQIRGLQFLFGQILTKAGQRGRIGPQFLIRLGIVPARLVGHRKDRHIARGIAGLAIGAGLSLGPSGDALGRGIVTIVKGVTRRGIYCPGCPSAARRQQEVAHVPLGGQHDGAEARGAQVLDAVAPMRPVVVGADESIDDGKMPRPLVWRKFQPGKLARIALIVVGHRGRVRIARFVARQVEAQVPAE